MSLLRHTDGMVAHTRGTGPVSSTSAKDPDAIGAGLLSVALIGPEQSRREALAQVICPPQASITREFSSYPDLDDVPRLLEGDYDVIIVELDSDPEHALDLVESICANDIATVMVYSSGADPEMLVRCMRAGAREFLSQPFEKHTVAEALVRASVRRTPARVPRKTGGKLFVFIGSKGGAGVTTLASNFAVCTAQESGQKTLLIDLNLPLGDAALSLGLTTQYSAAHALQEAGRLDYNLLSNLLVKHSSGLYVLAAPDHDMPLHSAGTALHGLLSVARQNFDYVVVDAGSRFRWAGAALFKDVSAVYLVTQVGLSELRNSKSILTELAEARSVPVQVVLNRHTSSSLGIDDEAITRTLTMPARWKLPSDYQATQNAHNTATPIAMKDCAISRTVRQMSRLACGMASVPEKKKRFGLFG